MRRCDVLRRLSLGLVMMVCAAPGCDRDAGERLEGSGEPPPEAIPERVEAAVEDAGAAGTPQNAPPAATAPSTPAASPVDEVVEGFSDTPIAWSLPLGPTGGGFNGYTGPSWFCMDLDGDGRLDLVWTGLRRGTDPLRSTIEPWVASGRPHWRVYRNTGTGFERDATSWLLPPQLRDQPGQWTMRNDTHSLFDVDGDARPDLVLVGRYDATTMRVEPLLDDTGRVEWRVFINRGNGFAGEPRHLRLPDSEMTFTSQLAWATLDMTGDGLLDLVVQGTRDAMGNFAVLRDPAGRPRWHVYRNASTPGGAVKFDTLAIDYALPGPGDTEAPNPGGDASWLIDDLDGDGRLDLTRTGVLYGGGVDANGVAIPYFGEVLRDGPQPYWKVYLGGDEGFGAPRQFRVPEAGHQYGYGTSLPLTYAIANDGEEVVSALWSTFDIDGDDRVELVDYGYATWDGSLASWGEPGDWWWKVYRQDEHGFRRHFERWHMPPDVRLIGTQAIDAPGTWLVVDLTGDGVLDLVLPAVWSATREGPRLQTRTRDGKPHWLVYPGVSATR